MSTNGLFLSSSTSTEWNSGGKVVSDTRDHKNGVWKREHSNKTKYNLSSKFNPYSYLEINVRSISVRVFEHLVDSCDIKWRFLTFLHISPSSVESVLSSQPIGVHPANSRLIKVWIKFVNHHFCEACFVLCFIFYCKGFTVFCFSTKLDLKSTYSGFVSDSPPCMWSYYRHI